MIDVYSTGKLLEEGRILGCEEGTGYSKKYFDEANKVLIFPTLEEAKKFGKGFGTYVLDNEGHASLSALKVTKTHPPSTIDEDLSRVIGALPKECEETWLIFDPEAFSKLEKYMDERKIEYQIK